MRSRVLNFLLCFCISVSALPLCASAETSEPQISAETAVLYCADNSEVLFGKNIDKRMKPASTTKIMTALLALEEASAQSKEVTFTNEMTAEGSSMYLKEGDVLTLRSLAEGMMLVSGNDSANAIALSVSGSTEKFAQAMNERAAQIGMTNTHFMNPSGLDHEEHYTTAYDLALLMAYAIENSDFADIVSKKTATIDFISPENKSVTYANHNRLLSLYPYCIGGKTGYTMAAGRCLVTAACKDGITMIAVTMNDRDDWNDHTAMFEYGFGCREIFKADDTNEVFPVNVSGAKEENTTVNLCADFPFECVVERGESQNIVRKVSVPQSISAPVSKWTVYGTITYELNGREILSVPLRSDSDVEEYVPNLWDKIKDFFGSLFSAEKDKEK